MIKVVLAAVLLLILAIAGLGIRLLLDKKAEFRGGSCQSTSTAGSEISCGCSGACEEVN